MIAFVLAALLLQQAPQRPWLGMAMDVRTSPGGGKFLYVGAVGPGTPAAKAGMLAGDIITKFDRKKADFRDRLDILEFISRLKAGQKVKITFVRGGVEMQKQIVVGALPAEYEAVWKSGWERATQERAARSAVQN